MAEDRSYDEVHPNQHGNDMFLAISVSEFESQLNSRQRSSTNPRFGWMSVPDPSASVSKLVTHYKKRLSAFS